MSRGPGRDNSMVIHTLQICIPELAKQVSCFKVIHYELD